MTVHSAYICFGSNAGCREDNIRAACRRVASVALSMRCSQPVESPDASGIGAPYINMVAECRVAVSLDEFRAILRRFEADGGRTATSKARGVMPIDIDIVEWDGSILSLPDHDRPYYTRARHELTAGHTERR